jgi:hypothetical protein
MLRLLGLSPLLLSMCVACRPTAVIQLTQYVLQLADKAIRDKLSRCLVIFGACAGLCYNSLWYFPTLIIAGGVVTALWDTRLRQALARLMKKLKQRRSRQETVEQGVDSGNDQSIELRSPQGEPSSVVQRRVGDAAASSERPTSPKQGEPSDIVALPTAAPSTDMRSHGVSIKLGLSIIVVFSGELISFVLPRPL